MKYQEYIYSVYQEKSFSKAARKLYVSQPWLSATVKKVEQEVKVPLFDRSTSPISLTQAGEYYISEIEKIMDIEETMRIHLEEMGRETSDKIHIGSSMFFCTYVLPRILTAFEEQYPKVLMNFSEGKTTVQAEALLDGQLDLLMEAELPKNKGIESIVWAKEELLLAVPANYPINEKLTDYIISFDELMQIESGAGQKPSVPLREFQDLPFIMLQEGNDSFERVNQLCGNAGFTPKISLYLAQMMTAYYLVCEGRGITFLRSTIPEYVSPNDKIVFYKLADPLATRNIYLSYRKKSTSPTCQALIRYLCAGKEEAHR